MKEGEYGNVNREGNPEAIGPDMGRVNKEAAKAARDFKAIRVVQNLMSPDYNKKKGGAVKHDDAKADKAMIAAELSKRGLKCGGKVKK